MNIVPLLEVLVNGLIAAEEKFFDNPKDFYLLESSVKSATDSFAADFLSSLLESMNGLIYKDGFRKSRYNVQRNDRRTLITSVGDVSFTSTYYKSRDSKGGYHYLLEEMLGVDGNDRFSEEAEAAILTEVLKTSYAEVAKVLPSKQAITKTTVMNKVHQIAEEMPYEAPEEKKQCRYLFIEADEDHVA